MDPWSVEPVLIWRLLDVSYPFTIICVLSCFCLLISFLFTSVCSKHWGLRRSRGASPLTVISSIWMQRSLITSLLCLIIFLPSSTQKSLFRAGFPP